MEAHLDGASEQILQQLVTASGAMTNSLFTGGRGGTKPALRQISGPSFFMYIVRNL